MCHPIWLPSRKYGTVWYHPASSKLWYLTTLSFVNFQGKLTGTSCDSLRVWSQLVRLAVCLALGARFASTWPTPVRPLSTTGQTGPCWWNLGTSTERPLHRSGWCSSPVRPVQARKPQIYQAGLSNSKLTQTRNSSNTGQQRTHPDVHPSKTQ
jgi:hypothetical protein